MARLLKHLWDDDGGIILSVELILLIGILVFGIIAGIVALRNTLIASLTTIGNTLGTIVPSFTFSGFAVGGAGGGPIIAAIPGYQLNYGTTVYLTGSQIVPVPLGNAVVVPPAP